MTTFKPAHRLESQPLALWLSILDEQAKLLHIIQKNLPANAAQAAKHCVLSKGQLILYVESAAWASQLRFMQAQIMAGLLDKGVTQVKSLQLKIAPTVSYPQTGLRHAQLPSLSTVTELKQLTAENDQDPLHQALAKLAKTLEKRLSTHN